MPFGQPCTLGCNCKKHSVTRCSTGCTCGKHNAKICEEACLCSRHKPAWNRGLPSPYKGKTKQPLSEATKAKIRATKAANPTRNTLTRCAEETKAKIRAARAMQTNIGMRGKHHTEETKAKLREARLQQGFIPSSHAPRPKSVEARKNISEARKRGFAEGRIEISPLAGRPKKRSECRYNGITLRSSWEVAYAKFLESLQQPWVYEIKRFKITNSNRPTYLPDFYLPNLDLYVEIKGWDRDNSIARAKRFSEQYHTKLLILDGRDLKRMGVI